MSAAVPFDYILRVVGAVWELVEAAIDLPMV
jgi:hypothetical protein